MFSSGASAGDDGSERWRVLRLAQRARQRVVAAVRQFGGTALGGRSALMGNRQRGTMVRSFISGFQQAKMETTMNAVEHNTRYSMMYWRTRRWRHSGRAVQNRRRDSVGVERERHDGAERPFKDWSDTCWSGLRARMTFSGLGAVWATADALFDIRESVRDLGRLSSGFKGITITINAGNLTTAEAARALATDRSELSRQLVQTS
jgi:hypothetical protein